MQKQFNILVTGIGGNVGQGILRNIIHYSQNQTEVTFRLIGVNVTSLSAGIHLCDATYVVPYAYEEEYISTLADLCSKEQIDLIIPSTDYEVYYLSLHKDKLPLMAISPSTTNAIFLDKYKTWEFFSTHDIPFAHAVLPSVYTNEFEEYIVKPREGRGSRGISFNPPDVKSFSDEYMVQQLWKGKEITCAFYITKQNTLHGLITFERELQGGATTFCQVNTTYDQALTKIIQKIIKELNIVGSCNLQAIVTAKGEIMPFEINGRISGTNSIRSQFGFKDVQYIIEEYLLLQSPSVVEITQGSAIRILMDVIYPNQSLANIKSNKSSHFIY